MCSVWSETCRFQCAGVKSDELASKIKIGYAAKFMSPEAHEFELLFRSAPIPMYLWMQKGELFDPVLSDFNDAASQRTGGRIKELLGKRSSEMYGEEPQILENFRTCLQDQKPVFRRMQYRLRSEGGVGTFRVAFIPLNDFTVVVAVVEE
jgi:hypothetical protein